MALLVAIGAALLVAVPAFADPIESKRAEAQQVLAQIQELDGELGHAIEAYNGATVELDRIRGELRVNRHELRVARSNLETAQSRLGARLRDLYTSDSAGSTLEVILGATSLDDLLNRIDTVNRVSDQDTQVLGEVKSFKLSVGRRALQLRRAHAAQTKLVARRAETRRRIEAGLAERQELLSSIRSEIARLEAEEQRRQEALARQAQARLAAQREAQAVRLQQVAVGVGAETPDANVAPPARYGGVVGIAMQYLGVPYVWGGASPGGFDCSGFVMYVYSQMGVSLPHHAASMWNYGVPVSYDQLEPGDLVFFDGLGHMGIYIGGGQFIHAPHTGDVVKISSLGDSWYAGTWVGARRIL
jgi:cell wall-associated NlpC family hydrolase